MENQHRKISGYRELSQAEIDLMNEIKALGPTIESLCDKVAEHIKQQRSYAAHLAAHENDSTEQQRLDRATPEQWEQWGRNVMQSALMNLTRAVAQPTFF